MKLPNLRLYDNQATLSAALGLLGVVLLMALAYCSLHGILRDRDQLVILYNAKGSLGKYRQIIVNGLMAATVLVGLIAAVLGFRSVGEKRNNRQRRSWLGLMLGAAAVALAPIFWRAWALLNESRV